MSLSLLAVIRTATGSGAAAAVALVMRRNAARDPWLASFDELAEASGYSRASVARALPVLEALGVILVERRRGFGHKLKSAYRWAFDGFGALLRIGGAALRRHGEAIRSRSGTVARIVRPRPQERALEKLSLTVSPERGKGDFPIEGASSFDVGADWKVGDCWGNRRIVGQRLFGLILRPVWEDLQ